MSGENLTLSLLDARGRPWKGETYIRIENDRERIIYSKQAVYNGPVRFTGLDSGPRGRHLVHVKTPIHVPVSVYTLVRSRPNELELRLPIHYEESDPYGDRIPYPAYEELPARGLGDIQNALPDDRPDYGFGPETPTDYLVRTRGGPEYYRSMTTGKERHHRRLACLFNLYTKLKSTSVSHSDGTPTWDVIDSIFCLAQDRMFARVRPTLDVESYLAKLEAKDSHFASAPSSTHDIDPPQGFEKAERTYKSKDDFGNLQLTFARRRRGEEDDWIVDVDIDERTGIGHLFEVLYHWVTGARTNPYAVHELLCLQNQPPPYELVTALQAA